MVKHGLKGGKFAPAQNGVTIASKRQVLPPTRLLQLSHGALCPSHCLSLGSAAEQLQLRRIGPSKHDTGDIRTGSGSPSLARQCSASGNGS